jgi:eukaryotic-like serine/threonine-protein kinase
MADPAPVDEAAPTQVSGPPAEASRPLYSERPSRSTGAPAPTLTPLETLRFDEIMRMRRFLEVGMVLIVAAAITVAFLRGDPFLKRLLYGALASSFCGFLAFLLYISDPARYSQRKALGIAFIGIATGTVACHFFGLYSPAPMIFMLGIYFFSLGASFGVSVVSYAFCAGLQGLGMLALALGLMSDRGIVSAPSLPVGEQIVVIVLVQAVYAATFLFARMSRRSTLKAVAGLEQALRQVGQREALLQEAHQDLEKVMRGGVMGRWSQHLVGPWKVSHLIGRGAMGEVYEARHSERDLVAAVKLLHADLATESTRMQRFQREAEIMSQLDSPNVVRVYDVGDGGQGPPYIAMELLRGHDLAAQLRKKRRLPTRRALELVNQVSAALEKARSADIVHRDIKPSNLFQAEIGDRHLWKVLDFGVSKLLSTQGTLTQGQVIGTPGYMSPEQARGGEIDHRADVFSLAAIAYRCLTGRPAFAGDDYPKILFDTVYTQPVRPSTLGLLPEDVDLVLAVGMAKQPEDRPARAVDFAAWLALAVDERLPDEVRARARALLDALPWSR